MSEATDVEAPRAVCTHHEVIAIGLIEVRKGQVDLTKGQQTSLVMLIRIDEQISNCIKELGRAEKARDAIVADYGPRITTLERLAARAFGYAAGVAGCVSLLVLLAHWLVLRIGGQS